MYNLIRALSTKYFFKKENYSMHEKEGLTQLFLFGNNQLGRLSKN
jgi:hypothetical protein